jgi:hypothetical protein
VRPGPRVTVRSERAYRLVGLMWPVVFGPSGVDGVGRYNGSNLVVCTPTGLLGGVNQQRSPEQNNRGSRMAFKARAAGIKRTSSAQEPYHYLSKPTVNSCD